MDRLLTSSLSAMLAASLIILIAMPLGADEPLPYEPTSVEDIDALMTQVDVSKDKLGYVDLKKIAYLTGHTLGVLHALSTVIKANISDEMQVSSDNKKVYNALSKSMGDYDTKITTLSKELGTLVKNSATSTKEYVEKLMVIQALELESLRLEIEILKLFE